MDDQTLKNDSNPSFDQIPKKEEEIKISEPTVSAQEDQKGLQTNPQEEKKVFQAEPAKPQLAANPPQENLPIVAEEAAKPAFSSPSVAEEADSLRAAILAQKKEDELLEEPGEEGPRPLIKPEEQPRADPGFPVKAAEPQAMTSGEAQAPVIPPFVAPPQAPLPVESVSAKKGPFSFLPKPLLVGLGVLLLGLVIFGAFKLLGKEKVVPSGEQTTLTYWGLWEPEPVVQGVIAQFEKEHPEIKIDYKMQSPQEYKARLQNALNSASGPDIFRFHPTWLSLMEKQLEPVPETVSQKLGLESNYFPVVKKAISLKERYYALPLEVDTLALYYNKDLLNEVGGKLPRTWWGLQELAKQITKTNENEQITTAGVALGTTNNVDHFSDIIGLMLLQSKADLLKPDFRTEEVLEYYTFFAKKDRVWDKTLPSSTIQFASGKLGFYFAPSWRYFEIKAQNPGLNFGIAKVPQLPESREIKLEAAEAGEGELTSVTWGSFWIEGVSVKSPHKKEAWEFLSFLASAEGLRQFHLAASQVRDFGEIYPLTNLAGELTTNPYLEPFVKQAENADFWYLCSETHDAGPNDLMIKYYEDALNTFSEPGGATTETLETLRAGVGQLVEQYKLTP